MHSTKIISLALGLSMLCGGGLARAQAPKPAVTPPAPPAPPTPSKELEAFMKSFEGSWKCETTFPAGMFGPTEVTAKTTVRFKKDFGGFFWKGEYQVSKQKNVPVTVSGLLYLGFNPGSQQITLTGIDSMGGTFLEAGKIDGDSVTTVGESYTMGSKGKIRETMSHKDKAISHKAELNMGNGWTPFGIDECKH
jgi:Protein of unknown function (DUF1579)